MSGGALFLLAALLADEKGEEELRKITTLDKVLEGILIFIVVALPVLMIYWELSR